jgi:hypothetical protein
MPAWLVGGTRQRRRWFCASGWEETKEGAAVCRRTPTDGKLALISRSDLSHRRAGNKTERKRRPSNDRVTGKTRQHCMDATTILEAFDSKRWDRRQRSPGSTSISADSISTPRPISERSNPKDPHRRRPRQFSIRHLRRSSRRKPSSKESGSSGLNPRLSETSSGQRLILFLLAFMASMTQVSAQTLKAQDIHGRFVAAKNRAVPAPWPVAYLQGNPRC